MKKFGHHYFLHNPASPRIAVRLCWMIKAVRQRNPWLIAKRYDSKEKVRKGSQDSATEAEILKENEDVSFPNWILEAARLETKAADFPQWILCLRLTDILIQTVSVLGPTAHIHANTKAPKWLIQSFHPWLTAKESCFLFQDTDTPREGFDQSPITA